MHSPALYPLPTRVSVPYISLTHQSVCPLYFLYFRGGASPRAITGNHRRLTNSFNCRLSAFLYSQTMQMTLSVSGRGLIALPAAMRKAAGIRPQDSVIAETTSEGILLRPAVTLPVEIYTRERIAEFDAAESELAQALELAERKNG